MGLLLLDDGLVVAAVARPAEAYARMMIALLPPGKLWDLVESFLFAIFLACADELARVDVRVGDMLNEADPSTALELLPEYERELDLVAAPSIIERRANVVGRLVRRQRFRPADFQTALASLLAQAAADVVVLERSRAFCIAIGDDREIYAFFIYRDPSLPGVYFVASAQALVDTMAPSHTKGTVIESTNMLYDSQFSLYDRDLLGA
ncbi:MAG: putative phage tail protein [Actinomycetota bacterium]